MLDQIEPLDEADAIELRDLVAEHVERTGSTLGQRVLDEWDTLLASFVKVYPTDYKRVLGELARQEDQAAAHAGVAANNGAVQAGAEVRLDG